MLSSSSAIAISTFPWNPASCVQWPMGHLPGCLIDVLYQHVSNTKLSCAHLLQPPSAPPKLSHLRSWYLLPHPSFSDPKLLIFSFYHTCSQQALPAPPSSSIPNSAPIPPGLLQQCPYWFPFFQAHLSSDLPSAGRATLYMRKYGRVPPQLKPTNSVSSHGKSKGITKTQKAYMDSPQLHLCPNFPPHHASLFPLHTHSTFPSSILRIKPLHLLLPLPGIFFPRYSS